MKRTITEALKSGEIVLICLGDGFDTENLEPEEDAKYIYGVLTGVTPYMSLQMPATQLEKYANEISPGLHLVNNHLLLYLINNRILRHIVNDELNEESKVIPLDPAKISIFEADRGKVYSIQDEDGLVIANAFDRVMKNIMANFHTLLNYYEV